MIKDLQLLFSNRLTIDCLSLLNLEKPGWNWVCCLSLAILNYLASIEKLLKGSQQLQFGFGLYVVSVVIALDPLVKQAKNS